MKRRTIGFMLLAATLLSIAATQASEFDGGWVGAKIGHNRNSPSSATTANKEYPGVEAGYNWNWDSTLLGVDAFGDLHDKSITDDDYGVDMKLGLPSGKFMPYAKLGLAGSSPGTRAHGGLGLEYKFASSWAVAGEWTADTKTENGIKQKNNNFSIGLNYYWGAPLAAPVAVAAPVPATVAPAPVMAPKPVVMPAPVVAPAPAETFKTVFTDKAITIEGTNFDTNSAKLKPAADVKLNEAVDFAAKYKDANLVIIGYTDSRGSDSLNQKLSVDRAESVKMFLINKGVAADRMTTKGEGAANPVGDNKTVAGRAQNRRVEIHAMVREEKKVRVTE